MKKFMCRGQLVALILVGLVLIGVTTQAAAPLRYITPWGGSDLEKEKRILEWVSAKTGIPIEVEIVPGGLNPMIEKLILYASTGVSIDISWNHMLFHQSFDNQGRWRDLRPFISRDDLVNLSAFGEAPLRFYTGANGQVTGLPFRYSTAVLNYNIDLFDYAGLAYPNDQWTYQRQFLDAARKLTLDKNGDGMADQYGLYPLRMHEYIWRAWGAEFLTPDYKNSGFRANYSQAVEALQFIRDLYQLHKVAWGVSWANWEKGVVGMVIENPCLEHSKDTLNWDVANIPLGPTGKRISRGAIAGWSLPVWSNRSEEAWTVLRQLASKEGQMQYIKEGLGGTRIDALRDFYLHNYNRQAFVTPVNERSFQNREVVVTAMDYSEVDPYTTIIGDFYNRQIGPLIANNNSAVAKDTRPVSEIVEQIIQLTNAYLAENPIKR